jgi:hypothetical protein
MNKKDLVAQCLADNPVMTQTINDVTRELSEAERTEAANAWADMRLERIAYEAKLQAKETQRQAILDRLGVTAEEAALLLS